MRRDYFYKNNYQGKFIVIEGIDGSGKSTQAKKLYQWIKEHKKKVHLTSEPTSYLIGGLIRSQLIKDWKSSLECLQLLFAADRAYHLEKEIIPLLKKGYMVISDRYFLSTIAYGLLEIEDLNWLLEINRRFLLPDLTFILDLPSEEAIKRMKNERFFVNLFEEKKKLEKVRKNYKRLVKIIPKIKLINGNLSVEEVFSQIKKDLKL